MPGDNDSSQVAKNAAQRSSNIAAQQQQSWADFFHIPQPVRDLFGKFPLRTYHPNDLPARSPLGSQRHVLYIFATDDTAADVPSCNPSCLKWQTFLKIAGVDFTTKASNNHASPTGSLPFILPANRSVTSSGKEASTPVSPIPSAKIKRWVEDQKTNDKKLHSDLREGVHFSLLDHRLRRAWLCLLYLDPRHEDIVNRLYIQPTSSNTFVRITIASQLRQAAEDEIRKTNPVRQISRREMLREGEDALVALSTLLGPSEWFFGAAQPGLFDAAVFAYTHLLLDERMGWNGQPWENVFQREDGNLKAHRKRILDLFYSH